MPTDLDKTEKSASPNQQQEPVLKHSESVALLRRLCDRDAQRDPPDRLMSWGEDRQLRALAARLADGAA